ncbi:Pyroglutamyl-peptidase 1 [Corynascus novoguineensis]|uniref:Pyroglutamyl-peptidase 1 n=1 Tax=Corynascus novoguineensis TaxID=1126955 RepID=A0AAN7HMS9_9PEZI|nr:Pyroglutamyl-peptidase 1 [Corynascus novoguineensis]
MGSVSEESVDQEPFTVLLTGFESFKTDYPVNPSWEIVRSLPSHLPPLRAKVPSSSSSSLTSEAAPPPPPRSIPPVRLLVHPSPIHVSYETVRELVPRLWTNQQQQQRIDAAVHVGMAGPRLFYSVERRGHREGYKMRDVDGQLLADDGGRGCRRPGGTEKEGEGEGEGKGDGEGEGGEKEWIWEGLPPDLESAFDVDDIVARWRGHSPQHLDLRISEDAGHYLCDFIYYSSLAHLEKAGERRRVLFLHVPSDASPHSISVGRELLLQLVRSLVESEVVRREKAKAEAAS